jgi:quercetin dioxygenase-like cupin family protein
VYSGPRGQAAPPDPNARMLNRMEYVDLFGQRQFSPEKLQKVPVFVSERMLFDQYCLEPGQAQRVHTHDAEDKVYVVLEGEALFEVGGERELLAEGSAVIARAGVPHGVRNDSDSELVLLVAMAPRPDAAG